MAYMSLSDIDFDAVYEKCGYSLTVERFDRKEPEPRYLFESLADLSDKLDSIIGYSCPSELKRAEIRPYFRKVK